MINYCTLENKPKEVATVVFKKMCTTTASCQVIRATYICPAEQDVMQIRSLIWRNANKSMLKPLRSILLPKAPQHPVFNYSTYRSAPKTCQGRSAVSWVGSVTPRPGPGPDQEVQSDNGKYRSFKAGQSLHSSTGRAVANLHSIVSHRPAPLSLLGWSTWIQGGLTGSRVVYMGLEWSKAGPGWSTAGLG